MPHHILGVLENPQLYRNWHKGLWVSYHRHRCLCHRKFMEIWGHPRLTRTTWSPQSALSLSTRCTCFQASKLASQPPLNHQDEPQPFNRVLTSPQALWRLLCLNKITRHTRKFLVKSPVRLLFLTHRCQGLSRHSNWWNKFYILLKPKDCIKLLMCWLEVLRGILTLTLWWVDRYLLLKQMMGRLMVLKPSCKGQTSSTRIRHMTPSDMSNQMKGLLRARYKRMVCDLTASTWTPRMNNSLPRRTPTIETLRDTCSPKSKPSIAKIKSITSTCLITQVPNKRKEIWRRNKKFSWMRGACNLDSRWPTSNVCNKMTWLRAIKEFCKARCSSRRWPAPKRIKRKLKCNKFLYIRLSSLEIKSSKCAWLGRGSNKNIGTF